MSAVAPPLVMTTLLPGFAGTSLPAWLADRLRAGLGGVCLFGQNIVSFEQLRALTDAIYAENPRALIAVDEEGGDVTRLFHDVGSPSPGNAVLGRIDDLASTRTRPSDRLGAAPRRVQRELRAQRRHQFQPGQPGDRCAQLRGRRGARGPAQCRLD